MKDNEICDKCQHFHNNKFNYTKSGPHIKKACSNCGSFISFEKQSPDMFIMPFGKYKGKFLADIIKSDKEYISWLISNNVNIKITDKIKEIQNHEY